MTNNLLPQPSLTVKSNLFSIISLLGLGQDWKGGRTASFGNVRPYEPEPPAPAPGQRTGLDLSLYPLKLVKLEIDANPGKKGWSRMKVSLPPSVRSRHLEDPVFGPEWKNLMIDFDEKLLN